MSVNIDELINAIANVALDGQGDAKEIQIGDEASGFRIDENWHDFQQYQNQLRIESALYCSSLSLLEFIGKERFQEIEKIIPKQGWDYDSNSWSGWYRFPDDDRDMQPYNWDAAKIRLVEELEILLK